MKKIISLFAVTAMAVFALSSCNKPKEDEPVVVSKVYFSAENGDYCFYVGADDAKSAVVSLVREDATSAATFSIKVNSATEGVVVPESVSFAAGESTTNITIGIPAAAKVGEVYDFDISLTGANVDTSASSDLGTVRCEGSVYLYKEVKLKYSIEKKGEAFNYFGYSIQRAWILDSKTFIFKGFLGSENDLKVTCNDEGDVINYTYSAYTLYNMDDGYDGAVYYFYNAEADTYDSFYPKGDTKRYIYGLAFDIYSNYSYAYVTDENKLKMVLGLYQVDIYGEDEGIDVSLANWEYMYFDEISDAEAAELDTAYPVIEKINYPDAKTIDPSTAGENQAVLGFTIGDVKLDDQMATVTKGEDGSTSYVVANLWYSDSAVTFTVAADGSFSASETNSYLSGGYYYFVDKDGYYCYYWPWDANYDMGLYGFSYYPDADDKFDSESKVGTINYFYWQVWQGADYTLGSSKNGKLLVTVK